MKGEVRNQMSKVLLVGEPSVVAAEEVVAEVAAFAEQRWLKEEEERRIGIQSSEEGRFLKTALAVRECDLNLDSGVEVERFDLVDRCRLHKKWEVQKACWGKDS